MKLSYRPEIDGLRAISVILVILYHLKIKLQNHSLFEFGYLGVDIFFVISGYLIGRIILLNLFAKKYSFKNFYESRARRLLPALAFILFLSVPLAVILLLPLDLIHFAKSALYSIFFSSNFFFFFSDIQYDAKESLLTPLLHTWSLGVEEQFYLFFPIFIFVIIKYLKNFFLIIVITGIFLSLCLAELINNNISQSLNFYMLPTRAWELLIGTLIAYFELKKGRLIKKEFLNIISPVVGALLLLISFLIFNDTTKHPSILSLIPITGVALVLASHKSKNNWLIKCLSTKVLVNIGLISYSLYLVHYPILSFYRIYFGQINPFNLTILIPVIFLTSIFSYKFVEKPFRNKKKINLKNFTFTILLSFAFLVITTSFLITSKGLSSRLPDIFSNESQIRLRDKLRDNKGTCFHRTDNFCNFNSFKNKTKVVLVGDSIMGSLSFDLKKKLDNKKINFKTIMIGPCYYIPDFEIKGTNCSKNFQEKSKKAILNEKNSIIILGGNLSSNLYDKKFTSDKNISVDRAIILSVEELLKKNHKIILVYPIPSLDVHVPQAVFNLIGNKMIFNLNKQEVEKKLSENIIFKDYKKYKSETKNVYNILDKLSHKNLHRIYPHTLFCDTYLKNKCVGNTEENFFYSDKIHPSKISSNMINNLIINKIDQINNKD